MNGLSLFIYFAEVVDNTRELLIGFSVIMFITFGIINLIRALNHADNTLRRWSGGPEPESKSYHFKYKFLLITAVIFSFVAAGLPGQTTMYMIAASEMSEMVVKDTRSQVLIDELFKKIEHEIKTINLHDKLENSG